MSYSTGFENKRRRRTLTCICPASANSSDLILNVGDGATGNVDAGVTSPSALWKAAVTPSPPPPIALLFCGLQALFISQGTFHLGLTENRFIHCFTSEKRKPHNARILLCTCTHTRNCAMTSESWLFLPTASDLSRDSSHLNERPMPG